MSGERFWDPWEPARKMSQKYPGAGPGASKCPKKCPEHVPGHFPGIFQTFWAPLWHRKSSQRARRLRRRALWALLRCRKCPKNVRKMSRDIFRTFFGHFCRRPARPRDIFRTFLGRAPENGPRIFFGHFWAIPGISPFKGSREVRTYNYGDHGLGEQFRKP